ncbi:MAG: UPF0716 protein FxsA [Bradymonadia bacterium]|jgi:UPF0716 protein FxsA
MLGKLFLTFTITTTVELFLLIEIGKLMGLGPTLGMILFTGFVGAWLAKREGLKTISKLRTELGGGQMPADSLLDGLAILVAGAFLLTPGVLTDLAGFSLLFPPTRALIKSVAVQRFQGMLRAGVASGRVNVMGFPPSPFGAGTIDAEFTTQPPSGPSERTSPAREPEMVTSGPTAAQGPERVYNAGDVIDITPT